MFWVAVFLLSGILTSHGKATDGNVAKRLNDAADSKVFQVKGKTYVYIHRKETWENARTACQGLGGDFKLNGDLASILSYKEYDRILDKLPTDECDYIWIGARWKEELTGTENFKHNWFWLTGEPLPFNHARWYNAAEPSKTVDQKFGFIHSSVLWTAENGYSSACGFLCHIH